MTWIQPTGFNDPDNKWTGTVDESSAYDGNEITYAYNSPVVASHNWTSFIEFTHSAFLCNKIKVLVGFYYESNDGELIDVDYYDGEWHEGYQGNLELLSGYNWKECSFASSHEITKVRVRFYNGYSSGDRIYFVEIYLYDNTPIVTVQNPTNVLNTSVIGNGNITFTGGANCTVRGFKYGLTKTDTWDAHVDGDFGTGAYTKAITSLSANTTYWIQAYITNPLGTFYSEWVQFQTAASGTIPTGTMLFVCSDYSAYSFQLMRSETDDGETYTAYFVISTDLTEKQGLAFYKRILDLHLYFMSEDSGTATIEVKRDNEASWQSVGSVSLTGTADIIIKHLAPDIRAKTFLFKISASNFFRFLGVLFEYIPEDLR